MVDRPIKKSDREAAAKETAQQAGSSEAKPAKRNVPPPIKKADRKDGGPAQEEPIDLTQPYDRDKDDRGRGGKGGGKGRGKGRGRDKDNAPKGPMNPALMRGPKPTKKVEEPEETAEETTEATAEETTEATGTDTAATETETAETTTAEATTDAAETGTEPAAEATTDAAAE